MSENSKIEWCDHTFNPWIGCTKISPGCDHCYAEAMMDTRLSRARWGAGQSRVRTSAANWREPVRWNVAHSEFFAAHGRRQRVFCASLADVFDNAVPEIWRWDLLRLIHNTQNLDWLLLTKRIGNARAMLNAAAAATLDDFVGAGTWDVAPWPNVWLGATIVDQQEANRDVPKLLATPARVRFLSMEPLLGPVDLSAVASKPCPNAVDGLSMDQETGAYECCRGCDFTGIGDEWGIDWVIVGGESGRGARPMHADWARSLRDQCAAAGVPFLFKQWGEWLGSHQDGDPNHQPIELNGTDFSIQVGKRAAGRLLDGRTHDEFPESH